MKKPTVTLLATMLLLSVCSRPSLANGADRDNIYTVLKQPPSLPYLPQYNGVKTIYFYGKRAEKLSQKRVGYDLEYQVMEQPSDVLEWYNAALKESGWQMDSRKNARQVSASRPKERYGLSVTVVPAQKPKYKGTLIIGYTMFKPQEDDSSSDSPQRSINRPANSNTPVSRPRSEYRPR